MSAENNIISWKSNHSLWRVCPFLNTFCANIFSNKVTVNELYQPQSAINISILYLLYCTSLNKHFVSASSSQVQIVPVTSPVPRVSSSPRASPTNTLTTWSAPLSSLSRPAWMSPSPSSPLTWRTTPCRAERGTASTTGWKCGTGSQEVRH